MKPRRVGLAREIFNTGNADAYCFAVVTHDIGEREKMLPSQIPILNKKFRSKTNVLLENANIARLQGRLILASEFFPFRKLETRSERMTKDRVNNFILYDINNSIK